LGLLILVQTCFLIYTFKRIDAKATEVVSDMVVAEMNDPYKIKGYANLDFRNATGAARIVSGFTDLLISSAGSERKGNGYELKLEIVNPSNLTLQNISANFSYYVGSQKKEADLNDINTSIGPGSSTVVSCFFSDLPDSQLSSILVYVGFSQMRYNKPRYSVNPYYQQ